MWNDVFKAHRRQTSKTGVESVDGVDKACRPVAAPFPGCTVARHGTVAESVERVDCVDCVDPREIDMTIPNRHIDGSMPLVALPSGTSRPDVATVPASTMPTPSTQSTPGKHCRLLTAQEIKSLLARFELVLVRNEMRAPVAGCYTADELRRTVNVAWWLITVEGWTFEAAVTAAGKWVIMHPAPPDEQHFVDVLAL